MTPEDLVSELFELGDDEIAAADASWISEAENRLSDEDFDGIALKAPQAAEGDIPVLIALLADGMRSWQVQRARNVMLVATERSSRRVWLAPVFWRSVESSPMRPPPPEEPPHDAALTLSASVTKHNARELLALPNLGGRFSMAALAFDWRSNLVGVDVAGEAAPTWRFRAPTPLPTGETGASYLGEGTPQGFGVRFTVRSRPGLVLQGSLAATVEACHLADTRVRVTERDQSIRTVAAAFPMTVLIVTRGVPVATRFDWVVPVYDAASLGAFVQGSFSIDATRDTSLSFVGDHAAYVVFEGALFGPAPVLPH